MVATLVVFVVVVVVVSLLTAYFIMISLFLQVETIDKWDIETPRQMSYR